MGWQYGCASAALSDTSGNSLLRRNLFHFVYSLPQEKRIDSATTICKRYCRKLPAEMAMAMLNQLNDIALKLNDRPLQCVVFWLRADYYSVNHSTINTTSIAYYQKAIDFARVNSLPVQTALAVHYMGMYYFTFKRYATAYSYFLNAQDLFKDAGYRNVPQISLYLNDVGVFYYTIGDYYNAKIQLRQAIMYKAPSKRAEISMINTIGLIYRRYRQFDSALTYFNTSLRLAKVSRDSAWIGIARGNIGAVYLMQNKYVQAWPFIRDDYVASLKYNEHINAAISLLRLAQISMVQNQWPLAAAQLDTAKKLLSPTTDLWEQWIVFNSLEADLSKGRGNLAAALEYQRRLVADKDSLAARNNLSEFEMMTMRAIMDNHVAQLNRLKTEERVGYVERNAIIIVLILLVVIFVLIHNRQLVAEKKEKELIVAEKKIVDEKLRSSVNELMVYVESLQQKNRLIEKFQARLESHDKGRADAAIVEQLTTVNVMTDDNWSQFKRLFLKVYPGFFIALKKSFPNLTETDMKLLALTKLRLSSREMAEMLGVTAEGIKKARQRLRKKMSLSAKDNVENVISSF
jgi:tetratricopeptide (TPR) repeat protein